MASFPGSCSERMLLGIGYGIIYVMAFVIKHVSNLFPQEKQ